MPVGGFVCSAAFSLLIVWAGKKMRHWVLTEPVRRKGSFPRVLP